MVDCWGRLKYWAGLLDMSTPSVTNIDVQPPNPAITVAAAPAAVTVAPAPAAVNLAAAVTVAAAPAAVTVAASPAAVTVAPAPVTVAPAPAQSTTVDAPRHSIDNLVQALERRGTPIAEEGVELDDFGPASTPGHEIPPNVIANEWDGE